MVVAVVVLGDFAARLAVVGDLVVVVVVVEEDFLVVVVVVEWYRFTICRTVIVTVAGG